VLAERFPEARAFDFVFHGGSGSSQEEMRTAVAHGVVKVNVDTDMQFAFTSAVADHIRAADTPSAETGAVGKQFYDPRGWGRKAERAMAARVGAACDALGSRGKSLALSVR
jgi:fructose-bisphosphate aldolase class II